MSEKPTDNAEPFFFAWHENLVQETLQILHDTEGNYQQQMQEVVAAMQTSEKFWHLFARFDDALHHATEGQKFQIMLAMFARMYAAGSLRNAPVIDGERVSK